MRDHVPLFSVTTAACARDRLAARASSASMVASGAAATIPSLAPPARFERHGAGPAGTSSDTHANPGGRPSVPGDGPTGGDPAPPVGASRTVELGASAVTGGGHLPARREVMP